MTISPNRTWQTFFGFSSQNLQERCVLWPNHQGWSKNFCLLFSSNSWGSSLCRREAGSAANYHANTGRFLLLPLESRKQNTSHLSFTPRASPTTTGNQKSNMFNQWETRKAENHILTDPPARGHTEEWKVEIRRRIVSTLAVFQRKRLFV